MKFIENLAPLTIESLAYVVIGAGAVIYIGLGLLTGGPRASQLPGAPRLYDRVYYLLSSIFWVGVILILVPEGPDAGNRFMIGGGVCLVGAGTLTLMRREMIVKALEYRAEHGLWLMRYFYRMSLNRMVLFGQSSKPQAVTLVVLGIGLLIYGIPGLAAALHLPPISLEDIFHFIRTLDFHWQISFPSHR